MALTNLRAQPWWTDADAAELELLVHELVRAAFLHRGGCSTCGADRRWCPAMYEALEAVTDWRDGRILRSKAAFLRLAEERAA
jgi:hypothetical protein